MKTDKLSKCAEKVLGKDELDNKKGMKKELSCYFNVLKVEMCGLPEKSDQNEEEPGSGEVKKE